ncbi:MAG: hypothetical protein PHN19_04495 [Patescibacteria group bacterium]|nr:hypothetical protein [Patescibacteria group bacterium]
MLKNYLGLKNLALISLLNALCVCVYVLLVSFIMYNGNTLFGKEDNFLMPIAFLLLFVFSAALTGTLVLGRPIMFYLDNKKNEAVRLFFYTLGWIFIFMIFVFTLLIALK